MEGLTGANDHAGTQFVVFVPVTTDVAKYQRRPDHDGQEHANRCRAALQVWIDLNDVVFHSDPPTPT
jgi:hypothetical protein